MAKQTKRKPATKNKTPVTAEIPQLNKSLPFQPGDVAVYTGDNYYYQQSVKEKVLPKGCKVTILGVSNVIADHYYCKPHNMMPNTAIHKDHLKKGDI